MQKENVKTIQNDKNYLFPFPSEQNLNRNTKRKCKNNPK
jgi:hypothetical protein